jgi:tetratricopeptide (TPR) repeat protein
MFATGLRRAALLAALLAPTATHACINTTATDLQGRQFQPAWYAVGSEMTDRLSKPSRNRPGLKQVRATIARVRAEPNFNNLNDLGVVLIYQGQYVPAIRHFTRLEQRFPGRHQTAANLGTALELAGYDDIALRWIRLGFARNPEEHYRTEWLHARILQAKIALKRDPHYLDARSVAGVDFAAQTVPPMPAMPAGNDGRPVTPGLLERSLSYQLFERTQFVAPKDPVVANLLRDWATLHLIGGSVENADTLYDLAVRYGAPRDRLLQQRQARAREALKRAGDANGGECVICGS